MHLTITIVSFYIFCSVITYLCTKVKSLNWLVIETVLLLLLDTIPGKFERTIAEFVWFYVVFFCHITTLSPFCITPYSHRFRFSFFHHFDFFTFFEKIVPDKLQMLKGKDSIFQSILRVILFI